MSIFIWNAHPPIAVPTFLVVRFPGAMAGVTLAVARGIATFGLMVLELILQSYTGTTIFGSLLFGIIHRTLWVSRLDVVAAWAGIVFLMGTLCFFVYLSLFSKPSVNLDTQFKITENVLRILGEIMPVTVLSSVQSLKDQNFSSERMILW